MFNKCSFLFFLCPSTPAFCPLLIQKTHTHTHTQHCTYKNLIDFIQSPNIKDPGMPWSNFQEPKFSKEHKRNLESLEL